MFLTVHAAFGALVATQTPNPGMAFFGGYLSHFLLDFIPHGDEKVGHLILSHKKKFILIAGIDIFLTALFTLFLGLTTWMEGGRLFVVLAGIVGATLPDFLSMAFPELHLLFGRNVIISTSYKILHALSVAQLVAGLNVIHLHVHQFFLHHYHFKLRLKYGLLLQTVFLGALLWLLSR